MRKRYYDLQVGEAVNFAGSRVSIEPRKSGSRVRICIETDGPIAKGDAAAPITRPQSHVAPAPTPSLPRPVFKPG